MTPDNQKVPNWARRDRQADLDWIVEGLDVFWLYASLIAGPGGDARR
jgi:hypothetical protein